MKQSTIQLLVGVSSILLLVTSCFYEKTPEPIQLENVSFNEDIVPIFEANCNSSFCHAPGKVSPDLSPANAWNNLQNGFIDLDNPTSSTIVTVLDGGSMEQYASDQDIATILQWIEEGANNN